MKGPTKIQKPKIGFTIKELSLEDKQRLVGAFVWLIKEDKKQNPELYQLKKVTTK
jgi:hypothetical protein